MENLKEDRMEAQDFYERKVKENPEIETPKLMEEYAKHIIEINFFDVNFVDDGELSPYDYKLAQRRIRQCMKWANS